MEYMFILLNETCLLNKNVLNCNIDLAGLKVK